MNSTLADKASTLSATSNTPPVAPPCPSLRRRGNPSSLAPSFSSSTDAHSVISLLRSITLIAAQPISRGPDNNKASQEVINREEIKIVRKKRTERERERNCFCERTRSDDVIKSLLRLIGRPTAPRGKERGEEKRRGEGCLLFRMLLREIVERERDRGR